MATGEQRFHHVSGLILEHCCEHLRDVMFGSPPIRTSTAERTEGFPGMEVILEIKHACKTLVIRSVNEYI